ncbi:MAG: NADH-dependent [FeFe] hydrogenase, group A6 [Bacillota bacterium]
MSDKLKISINGQETQVNPGTTVLEAANSLGIEIPTLCHMNLEGLDFVNQCASCRVCVVEVEGRNNLAPSCVEKVSDGMVVKTNTPRAIRGRRTSVELLLSNHPQDCFTCPKNLDCELQSLAEKLNIREIPYDGKKMDYKKDKSSFSIVKDPNKCIMCRRCETMCNEVQTCGILSGIDRGFDVVVGPTFNLDMKDTACTYCGQCVAVCPTASLTETNKTSKVWDALADPEKHVIIQTAPAIRAAIGEEFGMEPGTLVTGKMVSALKNLGFDGVFDTDFAADLTIMEEASELVHRIENDGTLPILTSCCPAWVKFIEHNYPELLDIPSSAKSPHIMFGAIAKTYYAEKHDIDPDNLVTVSLMPCVAKKAEAHRPELTNDEESNVDLVITTREASHMIKEAGLNLANMQDDDFDKMMGESSGAGVIFGTTGGVIEAATRTAYEWITGEELEDVNFTDLRGMDGIRSAEVEIGDLTLNIGIAHGLGNARELLECIKGGDCKLDAIEIMACPGGCIGGGGQPYHHGDSEILKKRQQALYLEDENKKVRKSHENTEIKKLYEDFLGKPYGKKAHELLHTSYTKRQKL